MTHESHPITEAMATSGEGGVGPSGADASVMLPMAMGRQTIAYVEEVRKTTTNPEDMLALAAKDVVQNKNKVVQWRRAFLVMVGVVLVLLGSLFGLMIAANEATKETHIRQGHVLMAGDDVVEAAPAIQEVPLHYLPFLDAHSLASTIGKSIMYTLNRTVVYDIVTKVAKPVNETVYEAQIHTMTATIVINSEGAKVVVNGEETDMCGAITCTKVSLTMADDIDATVTAAIGEEEKRRLLYWGTWMGMPFINYCLYHPYFYRKVAQHYEGWKGAQQAYRADRGDSDWF